MREISAINVSLEALGESRITDINTSNPSAGLARAALQRKRQAALSTGWWFNTIIREVTPAGTGLINVPWRQLSMYDYSSEGYKYSERDGVLYNLIDQTKLFSNTVTLRVILDMDFGDLPEYMAQWIAYDTAAEIYSNDLGVDNNVQRLQQQAKEMYDLLYREHLRNQRYSTASTGTAARIRRGFRI